MTILITGANGTVGTALREQLAKTDDTALGWKRNEVPPQDADAVAAFVRAKRPAAIFHLATASQSTGLENEGHSINVEWTAQLAGLCAELDIPFVYTSSVMVFTDDAPGPFTPNSVPDAREGYGYEKWLGEQTATQTSATTRIARIGWQIGESERGNQMFAQLIQQHAEQGAIHASTKWLPATSFLQDTAVGLVRLLNLPPSTYLFNSNAMWTYYEIVMALNLKYEMGWTVVPNEDFVYDQRMLDERIALATLDVRLDLG